MQNTQKFLVQKFLKKQICHLLVIFFSAFRNSDLKMKGYKGQRPKTANHIWVVLFKRQLEKTVNTRKMRRIWKVAKIAILLTLFNYGKAVKNDHFGLNLEIPKTHEKWLWRFSRLVLLKKWLEKSLRIWNMKSGKNGHFAKCSSNLFKSHLFCWLQICHRPDKHFGPLVIHKKTGRG